MRRISAAIVLLLLLTVSLCARETFIVDSYHVDVNVADDSTSTFNEFLNLDFIAPSHGMIRDIQYRFEPSAMVNLTAEISNIMTNTETVLSYNGDFLSLRLGDPDKYVFGPVSYHIKYDFLLEDDGNREYDEWYMNLLSPAWATDVNDFSFSVTFPHPVDPERIYLTWGQYGSTDRLDYSLSSDMRTISGEVKGLGPYSGVTLRVEFDEGYFSTKVLKSDFGGLFNILYIILGIALLGFIYYSYFKLGRDEEIIAPVRFSPPENLSSLDVGYIIDNTVTFDKDILSMFFYFADKGYLKIEERGADDFVFTKLKDIPQERPGYERRLFSLIFSSSDSVDMEDLARRNFCQNATGRITSDIERYYEKNHPLFEPRSIRRASLIRALGIAAVILFSIFVSIVNMGELTLFLLFPSLFGFALLSAVGHRYFANSEVRRNSIAALQIFFISVVMILMTVFCSKLLTVTVKNAVFSSVLAVLNTAIVFSSSFFSFAVNKRSEYADRMLTEILGYRDFLETVELDQLRTLIEEDPEYYYHNLSYAVALNLEEEYSRKFEAMKFTPPTWYAGNGSLGSFILWHTFSTRWRRIYTAERNIVAPPPSNGFRGGSSTHSGFSGFSGGGFSGGGGRSW